jgi:hypothetical protein
MQQATATPMGGHAHGNGLLVQQVLQANAGKLLIQVIDVAYLFGLLMTPAGSTPEVTSNVYLLADGSRCQSLAG